jgi:hypothetical protein
MRWNLWVFLCQPVAAAEVWTARVQPSHRDRDGRPPGKEVWLLAELPESESAPTRYRLCDLPAGARLGQSRTDLREPRPARGVAAAVAPVDGCLTAASTRTSSIPCPFPRFRLYWRSVGLFQCSWTPRLARRVVLVEWSGS